ncbi:MAG: metallophosphoesterase [bacterium]
MKIAHLSDIHIRKAVTRHKEYREVFNNLYDSLKKQKPDRILIVGDLFEDYLLPSNEAKSMAGEFLNELSKIAKVIVTRGNHDFSKSNKNRKDSIQVIVDLISNDNLIYYNKTGFYKDDNIVWVVWHHGDMFSPWDQKKKPKKLNAEFFHDDNNYNEEHIFIDLYHNPINGCLDDNGLKMESRIYRNLSDFKGDLLLLGDIHKKQEFTKEKNSKKIFGAYCGSLIAQKYSEGDDNFHGYLLWNINKDNSTYEEIPIYNPYSFKTVKLNKFTNFKNFNIDIPDTTPQMRIKVKWRDISNNINIEKENTIKAFLYEKYKNQIIELVIDVDEIVSDEIQINSDYDILTKIHDQSTIEEIFTEYLEELEYDEEFIENIIKLDREISDQIESSDKSNITWNLVKLSGKNFKAYENVEIDFDNIQGLCQISGKNRQGKSTIISLILFILYNKTLETEKRKSNGDNRYINNILDVDYCEGKMIINANGQLFGFHRYTNRKIKKNGEISKVQTKLSFHVLNDFGDDLNEENNVDNLTGERKVDTQKIIDSIIGEYDRFLRLVLTTVETITQTLSIDKATFIDSLLYDLGVGIFDKKLNAFKSYQKKFWEKENKINIDIDYSNNRIIEINEQITLINKDLISHNDKLNEINQSIKKGREYKDSVQLKFHQIDETIKSLTEDSINNEIIKLSNDKSDKKRIIENDNQRIQLLKNEYDLDLLDKLDNEKIEINNKINNIKNEIKNIEITINNEKHLIAIINGKIENIKKNGKKIKEDIEELKSDKTCPTCGQLLKKEQLDIIKEKIQKKYNEGKELVKEMEKLKEDKIPINQRIADLNKEIKIENENIFTLSVDSEKLLEKIANVKNQKNEVEERNKLIDKVARLELEIKNIDLNLDRQNDLLNQFNRVKKQIEENSNFSKMIKKADNRLEELENEKEYYLNKIESCKLNKQNHENRIKEIKDSIKKYINQEKLEKQFNVYEQCIHRNGIPTQILLKKAIPMINNKLESLLRNLEFIVWLDDEEFELMMAPKNNMNANLYCIGGSGMEKTFGAISLKYCLNELNSVSKPSLMILDEVMGTLKEESVEMFIQFIHSVKNKVRHILMIEHNHNIEPDYIFTVEKNDNGIAELKLSEN